MPEIIFQYKGEENIIYCELNDKIKDIINKYILKIGKNNLYFIYSGNKINAELKFNEIANKFDKERNKMNILVFDEDNDINEKKIILKDFICPNCCDSILIKIQDYKINYKCKNRHLGNNILINEYENIQKLIQYGIVCDKCKKNDKNNSYNNEFYYCFACNMNLCPLCKSIHNENHNIINYDDKNYICKKHNEEYIKFCQKCDENICTICEIEHYAHKMINFDNINIKKYNLMEDNEKFKDKINEFKNEIEEIKNKFNDMLNQLITDIEIYYKINNIINLINNKNYYIIKNINELNSNIHNIINDLNIIINNENVVDKLNNIINIYNKISISNTKEIIY